MAEFKEISCKNPELRADLVTAKMFGLEKKVVFKPDSIVPIKNEKGNFTIGYNGIELRANVPEINFKSAKELTSKIVQAYIDKGYKGNIYSHESVMTSFFPSIKDSDTIMLLQVDEDSMFDIFDTTLTYSDEFKKAFGFIPTRGNDLMKAYAIFLNEVISDVKQMYDDCNKSILNRDRLREADNTTPPKSETQTPQQPLKESGQTKLAGFSK